MAADLKGEWRVVVMGPSGCGKSTVGQELAQRAGWEFIDGDDLHPAANVAKMARGEALDDADRTPWLRLVAERLAEGVGVVVACSALKRAYRDQIRAQAGQPVRFVYLDVETSLLQHRLQARSGHFMPSSLLDSQLATLEPPHLEEEPDVHILRIRSPEPPQEDILQEVLQTLNLREREREKER